MRSVVNGALHSLRPTKSLVTVGRCHYHTNSIPIIKTIDDETLVGINVGIRAHVDLR